MPRETLCNTTIVLFGVGGLASGLVTAASMYPYRDQAGLFAGLVFGFFLVTCLLISGIPISPVRAAVLIVAVAVAYFVAVLVATSLQMLAPAIVPKNEQWSTPEPASPIALLFGGFIGGYIVCDVTLLWACRGITQKAAHQKALLGALIAGALGVAGWALRSSIGVAVWHLFHAPRELSPRWWYQGEYDYTGTVRMSAVYVVWQAGVAITLGHMLRGFYKSAPTRPIGPS